MFVISLYTNPKSFYDGTDGDPGRTCRLENAKFFTSFDLAGEAVRKLEQDYPEKMFAIEFVYSLPIEISQVCRNCGKILWGNFIFVLKNALRNG